MGRRGRKRNLNLEDEYGKLILAGVGPIAAARHVGIGRTTGHRWRSQRGGVAPLRMNEVDRHERYLSLLERERLALLRREGLGVREISRRLGRSASTISRELRRNIRKHDRGHYDAILAHARSREMARRDRSGVIAGDLQLKDVVYLSRDDLPSAVLAGKQWADQDVDEAFAHWSAVTQTPQTPRRSNTSLHRTGHSD